MTISPTLKYRHFPTSDASNSTWKSFWKGIDALALPVKPATGSASVHLVRSQILTQAEIMLDIKLEELLRQWPEFTAQAGEIIELPISHPTAGLKRIYLVGIGTATLDELRKSGVALGRKVKNSGKTILNATLPARANPSASERTAAQAHLVSVILSNYSWDMKSTDVKKLNHFEVVGNFEREIDRARTLSSAVWRARDLIHTPANIKTPAWLASQAKSQISSTKSADLSIEVLSGKALEEFGGLVAIGKSSPNPGPRFIKVSYAPKGSRNWPHVVLVGKGITFDTGGISLKRPYDNMVGMKTDMSGAAIALSVVTSMPEIKPKVRVTALMMCAENLLSSTSTRPSDVITQYGGTTVEVINTDAEGRLVLADGLAYADINLNPDYLIDIATLTGSATLGLSRQYAAMYGHNKKLMSDLSSAGNRTGDRVWQMPLVDEYRIALKSSVADLNSTAEKPNFQGGSITAALFLEHFVGKRNWVHLDIAGPARSDSDSGENPKGGTAFGVRLLMEWISQI